MEMLLAKDVMLIVYRYVFDYRYTTVKREYVERYLTGGAYWGGTGCFQLRINAKRYFIANYRNPRSWMDAGKNAGALPSIFALNKNQPSYRRNYRLPLNY